MELLRLHFPGVHHALREALVSLSNFASYLLGDTVPSAEERGGKFSRRDEGRVEELGERTAEGSQQAEESEEALAGKEVTIGRDLEDTFFLGGSECKEAWGKGKEKKSGEIQKSETEGIWETEKEVGVGLNEEITRVFRTWDSSNKDFKEIKEAKGEIRGKYKIEGQGTWYMMGTEPKQGQNADTLEARKCQKERILDEGYLESEELASEEKGVKELKAQGEKNQESKEKEVHLRKAENHWRREETEPVREQKEEVKESKPGDPEGRTLVTSGVESENGIIWEDKQDREAQVTGGNVRDWEEAKEGKKAQRVKGEPGNDQRIEMETRKNHEMKKVPDGALGKEFGESRKVEAPEKLELEKHEVKEIWEPEKNGIRCAKKEMEKEVAWEVQYTKPENIDLEKLQGVQEPGEKSERENAVKSEVSITSVMEKAEVREAIKSKIEEITPKKGAEQAWKAEDLEISREWDLEVIQKDWDTEEAVGGDLERKKDEERATEENTFSEEVWTQRKEREEEMADFWVLEKREIVKVLNSGMEIERSWGLEGEAREIYESQSGQTRGQGIQEAKVWKGILDIVSERKEIESVEAKEVMRSLEIELGRPHEIKETERIDDSNEISETRSEKAERVNLMREAEVEKNQELEKSYEIEKVREDQCPKEIEGDWNMEEETGKELMEEDAEEREEQPLGISERETLEGCEMDAHNAQNIKNTENGNVQEVKKQDLALVKAREIMETEVESGQVREIESKGGWKDEKVFIPQTREDKGAWETKGSQEFKYQEAPKAEAKTDWRAKQPEKIEPEKEEKEVRGVWEKELEGGGQEAHIERGHKMEESGARKLQEREKTEAKEYWEAEGEIIRSQETKKVEGSQEREDKSSRSLDREAEGEVIRSQDMKEIEGSQEREDKSSRALGREAEVGWEGNAESPWNSEIVSEKAGLILKKVETGRSQEIEQKVKRDWKEIKRDWNSEEKICQQRIEARESPNLNLLEVGVKEVLEEENKGFWKVKGTKECQATEGMTERDLVEESEVRRTWEREEEGSEGDQETDSVDTEESCIIEKEKSGSNCEKEKFAFCHGAEIQRTVTNKELEFVKEEKLKEGQIKSEEKPGEGKENRETEKEVGGGQDVDCESTWPLEEERQYEEETETEAKAGGSHAEGSRNSMDNQSMEKAEANGGRGLEAENMEDSGNREEVGSQEDRNREELKPTECSDAKEAADWRDGDRDSEAAGVWESSEKTARVWDLEKAKPSQGKGTEEAADTGSGTLEASENRQTEAPSTTNSIALMLSPVPNPAADAQNIWSEAPLPGSYLNLSIPRSRVLLSRNASHRRSRPSFRRVPAPRKDDCDDNEALESSASKLRLFQSEETIVPSPLKPEGTPVPTRKRPPGHGFGLAHPSMMQELQARLGRPKPQ
ncbi:apolipoprotein B receptor [Monodelphis domestica]|uniref:Apolipoprotein B receptor n=1 Tax=Monodelphis domestica TaxID=13616 RepID=A0A5F8GUB9_MONDO|nr:apolipoprotein B receptor [Monodelphis domestica]